MRPQKGRGTDSGSNPHPDFALLGPATSQHEGDWGLSALLERQRSDFMTRRCLVSRGRGEFDGGGIDAADACGTTERAAGLPGFFLEGRVVEEDITKAGVSGKLDFETVTRRLVYLEQVIKETVRLYPPGLTFVTRQAKEDFAYRGTQFKARTCFMVPLYQIQRDPRFWPDPLQFNPERFGSENEAHLIKVAYMPFGLGPRNCVGKSMATLILKLAMAKLLLQYRLELGPSQMVRSNAS
ncbi:cytochrome P450 3A14-like [Rhipicephalus microplus]|uniref:cytochrome P450 3A14-like n=1 Tax=Rhipicephalus microplus TaxID=6941 RepID=UPI003F6C5556